VRQLRWATPLPVKVPHQLRNRCCNRRHC
jgi:hypothetical protein